MEDKTEEIHLRIKGWMQSNRMGEQESEPYFWSIYKVASMNAVPVKNQAPVSENISIENLEPSLDHLMECMSHSTHIKYYFIRLRAKKTDPGVINNYQNPYYQMPYNHKSYIGNLPQAPQADNTMMLMIGMLNGMQEERRTDREASQAMLLQLQLQQKDSDFKLEKYKHKQEVIRLKEENAFVGSSDKSFFRELFTELKPDIIEGLKYIAGRNTAYNEDDDQEEEKEEKGEQIKDNNNESLLNNALNMIATTNVKNPERLISKIAIVLTNISEDERNQLLGGIQNKYDEIKESKSTKNE